MRGYEDSMQAEAYLAQGELIMKVKTDVKAGSLLKLGVILVIGGCGDKGCDDKDRCKPSYDHC